MSSDIRPVSYGTEIPIPTPPNSLTLGDDNGNDIGNELCPHELSDAVFVECATASSESQLLSQSYLNDLVYDLSLSK